MIFISHAAVDSEIAVALKDAISAEFPGVEIFVSSDPEDLAPGDPWIQKILDALDRAVVVLALTTERGLSRKWVWFESGRTWFTGVRLIPCSIGRTRKSALQPPFSFIQGLNIDLPEDLKNLFVSLAAILGKSKVGADFAPLASELIRLDLRAEIRQEVQKNPHAEELRAGIRKKMGQLPTVQKETIRQLLQYGELSSESAKTILRDCGQNMDKFFVLDALARDTGWLTQTYRAPNLNDQWQNAYKVNEKLAPYLDEYFRNEASNRS
jgi:hypothetical protein